MKKFTSLAVGAAVLSMLTVSGYSNVSLAADDEITVTLRIEGVEENIYYDEVTTDKTVLTDILKEIDESNDSFEADIQASSYGSYLVAINDDVSGKFGGYDGWMYTVNGEVAPTGIDTTYIKDGDTVVFYYGDPYGVGFQTPIVNLDNIKDGVIAFTSMDEVYAPEYAVLENPIEGAKVTWYYGDNLSKTYVTDKDGKIQLENGSLEKGAHKLTIEKASEAGLPMVLRFEPDYGVVLAEDYNKIEPTTEAPATEEPTTEAPATEEPTTEEPTMEEPSTEAPSTEVPTTDTEPSTGDDSNVMLVFAIMAFAGAAAVVLGKNNKRYEK